MPEELSDYERQLNFASAGQDAIDLKPEVDVFNKASGRWVHDAFADTHQSIRK